MRIDVQHFRDEQHIVHANVKRGAICPQCGSGEVYQPGQTMNMPMIWKCLRCGLSEPSRFFRSD